VVHRLADPPDRLERLPRLPDGSAPRGALWLRSGEMGVSGQGALWRLSSTGDSYRSLLEPVDESIWDVVELPDGVVELPDGRWLATRERLVAEEESAGVRGGVEGRPRESVEFRVIDSRSGASRLLWEMPGAYRPGLGLDPSRRTLWINRWQEESDLWIARSGDRFR
jgi:hypothetical protein